MSLTLLDLPTELLTQILSCLKAEDISNCQLVNKFFHTVIHQSMALQYQTSLEEFKALDNPCSNLPVIDKLQALTKSEENWAFLRPNFTKSIPVTHNPSGIYDLSGGVYLLGNFNKTELHYLRLPAKPEDEPQWTKIKAHKTIIDMGLCVFEHDLIAIITTQPKDTPQGRRYEIEIQLHEFSTGNPHPDAKEHTIKVMTSQWEKPALGIEIVGDNLVLILTFYNNPQRPSDRIYVYEWKTGVLKTSWLAPFRTYSGLLFLREDLILLPNNHTNALDIFALPAKPTFQEDPQPALILGLPALAEGRIVGNISCRSEPNPIGASSHLGIKSRERKRQAGLRAAAGCTPHEEMDDMDPKRGFLANPDDAICVFALRINGMGLNFAGGANVNVNFHFGHTYTFFMHRRSLIDAYERYTSEVQVMGEGEETTQSTGEGHRAGRVSPGVETGRSTTPSSSSRSDGSQSKTEPGPKPILWASWGPGISRWFNADSIPTRWITTSAGQRCVLIADTAPDNGFPYVVLDFNESNVKRMKKWLASQARKKAMNEEALKGAGGAKGTEGEAGKEKMKRRELDQYMGIPDNHDEDDYAAPADIISPADLMHMMNEGYLISHPSEASGSSSSGSSSGSPLIAQPSLGDDDPVDLFAVSAYAGDEMITDDYLPAAPELPYEPSPDNRIWCVDTSEAAEPADTFAERVEGSLPYVACASQKTYTFDGVLIDEERVIGIKTDVLDRIKTVEIHHFG